MNPGWEFQTAGAVVDRIVIPILAFGFIFFAEGNYRKPWEMLLLKLLSWMTLLVGIACFILIPLVLAVNAQRLAIQIDEQASGQLNQQLERIEQAEETVTETTGDDLVSSLESQGATMENQSPQAVKEELLANITNAKQDIRTQAQSQITLRKTDLKKSTIKWVLGSVVAGILFIYMWVASKWARLTASGLSFSKKRSKKNRYRNQRSF
jgi:hypothetical protein